MTTAPGDVLSTRRGWRDRCAAVAAVASTAYTLVLLGVSQLWAAYDLITYARHAALIRRAVPRWVPVYLLPLVALVCGGPWGTLPGPPSTIDIVEVIVGVALIEVYGVGLRREATIASFEPELIPHDARPLGGRTAHPEDRRLQHLLRTQLLYGAPVVLAGCLLRTDDGWPALVLTTLFFVKFAADAGIGFEVVFHWDLHARVLDTVDRPWLGRLWRGLAEWFLGPVFGYAPRLYAADHLLVHHRENSGRHDTRTLVGCDRSSFVEFSAFTVRFSAELLAPVGLVTSPRLDLRRRAQVVVGVLAHCAVLVLAVTQGRLIGWLLLAALAVHDYTAARSQLTWHGLIDTDRPRDPLASTILWTTPAQLAAISAGVTDAPATVSDNPTTDADWPYLDNYHLTHHLHPRAHFTALPGLVRADVRRMVEHRAAVLDLAGITGFALACWTRDHRLIADGLLIDASDAERVEFVRRRLEPDQTCRTWIARAWTVPAMRGVEQWSVSVAGVLLGAPRRVRDDPRQTTAPVPTIG